MPVRSSQNRQYPDYARNGMFVLFLVLCLWSLSIQAAQVMLIVGYDGENWYPYISELSKKNSISSTSWKKLSHIQDPVVITRQSKTGVYFVKTDRGDVVVYAESPEVEMKAIYQNQAKENNFTHLRAHDNGLLMVELKNGRSRETQIINIDSKNLVNDSQLAIKPHVINNQLSSQFHPLLAGDTLFYAHVSCRGNCDPVIQEVWKKNMVTGKAEQITLLNATTYLHSVDYNLQFGYLCSNKKGYYHLGRINLGTGDVQWLTSGQNTYSYPSISEDNDLYFIQRTFSGTGLMKLSDSDLQKPEDATFKIVELPVQIKKIRYLEISNL